MARTPSHGVLANGEAARLGALAHHVPRLTGRPNDWVITCMATFARKAMTTHCRQCTAANELQPGTTAPCVQCGAPVTAPAPAAAPSAAPSAPAPARRTSKLAVASLVLAFLICVPVLPAVLSVGLGIAALVAISKHPNELKGSGLAIGGIAVATVAFFFTAILFALAIPNFMKFQARAKQSEAKANLKALYTANRAYEAEQEKPASHLADLGFSPEPHRRYAYFVLGEAIQPDLGGPYELPAELAAAAEAPGVLGVAVSNLDSDATLDVWTVDQSGRPTALSDDTKD